MSFITETIEYLSGATKPWVIIPPWNKAIRVRFGKYQRTLNPGIYFKLPLFDKIFSQTIRTRINSMPVQTLTTKDGKTLTLKSALKFKITNIQTLYNTIDQPETTIVNMAMSYIAQFVSNNNMDVDFIKNLEEFVLKKMSVNEYGLEFEALHITSHALIRAFRLIQDSHWEDEGIDMREDA